MQQVTLGNLIQNARLYADMVNNDFMSTAEWIIFINDALRRYYDLIEQLSQDYYFQEYFFFTQNNVLTYPLPNDFYHLRGVDVCANLIPGSDVNDARNLWVALSPFMFDERNTRSFLYYQAVTPPYFSRYRIQGNDLKFEPLTATANSLIRISYTVICPVLQNLNDTFDVISGYDAFISKVAAMSARARQESDVSFLMADIERFEAEIKRLASDRNRDQGMRISDVYAKQMNIWGF